MTKFSTADNKLASYHNTCYTLYNNSTLTPYKSKFKLCTVM